MKSIDHKNNKVSGSYSIVIGEGLTATEDFQLLVDKNGVKIDKIMTPDEWHLIYGVVLAMSDNISGFNNLKNKYIK